MFESTAVRGPAATRPGPSPTLGAPTGGHAPEAPAPDAEAPAPGAADVLLDRLAALAPGGDLAVVLEELMSYLLVPAETPSSSPQPAGAPAGEVHADTASGTAPAAAGALLPDPLHPAERSLADSEVDRPGCGGGSDSTEG